LKFYYLISIKIFTSSKNFSRPHYKNGFDSYLSKTNNIIYWQTNIPDANNIHQTARRRNKDDTKHSATNQQLTVVLQKYN